MDTIIKLAWALVPGIIVGIVMARWNREQKARDERAEKQEAQRVKSERVRISLLMATSKLSYAVAMATKRGYPNGEIEEGIERYEEAMKEFKEFERELLAEKSAIL